MVQVNETGSRPEGGRGQPLTLATYAVEPDTVGGWVHQQLAIAPEPSAGSLDRVWQLMTAPAGHTAATDPKPPPHGLDQPRTGMEVLRAG